MQYYFIMKRSLILLKQNSNHQYGWYERYIKLGPDGFKKNPLPTPFDWNKINIQPLYPTNSTYNYKVITVRPKAYFELSLESEPLGRIVFELAEDIVPKTVENFRKLCLGLAANESLQHNGYKGTKLYLVRKNETIMGGDIECNNGNGNHSAYQKRHFEDENFIIPHSYRGLISMVSVGVHTNGSQFYIDLAAAPHLNGRCMVFGRIVEGDNVLKEIEKVFTVRGAPVRDIVISECGYIEGESHAVNEKVNGEKKVMELVT